MVTFSPPDETDKPEILVVDDDPMVREVVVESIRAAGYDVEECGDGQNALEKNEARSYDLILTDMRLPGMDGLTLIKKLKSSNSDTDVLVMTGYGSVENAVECMKAGALDYLIKPFTVDQIQVAVTKAVEHRDLRRRALEREFYRELSYVDALTGIRNRRFFDESLESEVQKATRHGTELVLLMIDIDDFKLYNDLNGHQKGDLALKKMGQLFMSVCRGYDIVTRYGGEEFAILFPGATEQNAMELSRRIVSRVRNTKFDRAELLPSRALTVSVGVACFPRDAESAEDLVRCADSALYDAKKAGKNTVQLVCR
jgi:diguanylate cyclase (GGDEF)-like protein